MKKVLPKYLIVLIILLTTLLLFLDMTDAQRNRSRANRRRNSNTRGRNRNRPGHRRRPSSGGNCEEIQLPMCKGLVPYTHTKLPNRFNHTTQLQVYRELEHLWAYMDHSCSVNTRLMICTTYLPKCTRRNPSIGPCKRTCMHVKRRCARSFQEAFRLTWVEKFSCTGLPRRRCLNPIAEEVCERDYPICVSNSAFPVCTNLTFSHGTIPNMFYQCHTQQINRELRFFNSLRRTNCHPDLDFLLCGVYSPFCIRAEIPFTFPCREICTEIRAACEAHYSRLNNGLPWPNKLQCHRYPAADASQRCVMPNEGQTFLTTSNKK